jgi:hypothetical protein
MAVPESGVFNFTTVDIPEGVLIYFTRNSRNTPLTILATGNVNLRGQIHLEGAAGNSNNGGGGQGGPGGFDGGRGGCNFDRAYFAGTNGEGPGGGGGGAGNTDAALVGAGGGAGYARPGIPGDDTATGSYSGQGGPVYGASTVQPLIGGSGGGGGGAGNNTYGCSGGGGGGGGAILIASSGIIYTSFPGGIFVSGGSGGPGSNVTTGGGGGSGGSIRLIANTVTSASNYNSAYISTSGGNGGSTGDIGRRRGGAGSSGYLRVEAYDYRSFIPLDYSTIVTYDVPHPVNASNGPRLRIASVGGVASPALPAGALYGPPDIVLPSTQTGPVEVLIEGANLPLGTTMDVTLTPEKGARTTVRSSALAGTEAASTARASLTLPSGVSVIAATAIIDLTAANTSPLFIDGERVKRMEVAATFGGATEVTYVTGSGRRIKRVSN